MIINGLVRTLAFNRFDSVSRSIEENLFSQLIISGLRRFCLQQVALFYLFGKLKQNRRDNIYPEFAGSIVRVVLYSF